MEEFKITKEERDYIISHFNVIAETLAEYTELIAETHLISEINLKKISRNAYDSFVMCIYANPESLNKDGFIEFCKEKMRENIATSIQEIRKEQGYNDSIITQDLKIACTLNEKKLLDKYFSLVETVINKDYEFMRFILTNEKEGLNLTQYLLNSLLNSIRNNIDKINTEECKSIILQDLENSFKEYKNVMENKKFMVDNKGNIL